MSEMVEQLRALRIVPVIVIDDAADAAPLADALMEGGLPCAEVTLRTPAAMEALRRMSEAHPDLLVGAGTVLNPAQVDEAVAAGAKFIVSPGIELAVVDRCLEIGIPVFPGVCTPTEAAVALGRGLKVV
jgi:2-dehydro-3-deoxyphosphogluconate aldolase/(4S)-4-hydroxy-2-oxoglutarate aldolase